MKILHLGDQQPAQRCVITLGVGRRKYTHCLKRLVESIRHSRFEGDVLVWCDELPPGSPRHFDSPAAFKSFCFKEAERSGYRQALWIDAQCVVLRSLEPLFTLIEANGYVLFANNYDQMMGQWCSDLVLAMNQLTREEALMIPEIPTPVMGFDMNDALARQFLAHWHEMAIDGISFRGIRQPIKTWSEFQDMYWNKTGRVSRDPRVRGHRCDQTAAGIIGHRLGMLPYADGLRDIHFKRTSVDANTIILHHRERCRLIAPLSYIYLRYLYLPGLRRSLSNHVRSLIGRFHLIIRRLRHTEK